MSNLIPVTITVVLLFLVPAAMPRKLSDSMELFDSMECSNVVQNFTSCQGFIQGLQGEPGDACCCGVHFLNTIAKQGHDEVERICRCIEEIAVGVNPPFNATRIEELPVFCHTHLSFPISVAMNCSSILFTEKEPKRTRGDLFELGN